MRVGRLCDEMRTGRICVLFLLRPRAQGFCSSFVDPRVQDQWVVRLCSQWRLRGRLCVVDEHKGVPITLFHFAVPSLSMTSLATLKQGYQLCPIEVKKMPCGTKTDLVELCRTDKTVVMLWDPSDSKSKHMTHLVDFYAGEGVFVSRS